MIKSRQLCVFIATSLAISPLQAAPCNSKITETPTEIGAAVAFSTAKLEVDADGAPNSYTVDGDGLSNTCDGVVGIVDGKKVGPGQANWYAICQEKWKAARASGNYSEVSIFGFYTDPKTGVPVVQGKDDPLPDKGFVSTTSLSVPGAPESSQHHWVDATKIPYIVLTKSFAEKHKIGLGNVAVVYLPKSEKFSYAVYADSGPALGEASVSLHQALGHNPISKHNGIERANVGIEDSTVVTLVFPGKLSPANVNAEEWNRSIVEVGQKAFEEWGGVNKLRACVQ